MLYFRSLTTPPNFARTPQAGTVVERNDLAIGQTDLQARWPSFPQKTLRALWTFRGPTEVRAHRVFLSQVRGSWQPVYVPTWHRDFGATGDISIGDDQLTIDLDIGPKLTSNRPDSFGRTVFIHTPAGNTLIRRVLTSSGVGPTFTLTLDRPFTEAFTAQEALCGFCLFARLSTDDIRHTHSTPDRLDTDLTFLEIRARQESEGTFSCTGQDIEASESFVTVLEENEDPWQSDFRSATCLGPAAYSAAQPYNFVDAWTATLAAGAVTLTGSSTETSTLYDGDDTVEMITLAFDVLGDEALAWQSDFDTVRLRWFDGGTPQALDIVGARTPVLFQNWTINGAIDGGDADLVLYYLKGNDAKVFARYQREDFATEHIAIRTPIMPLALIGNNLNDTVHELRAMSTRLTRLTFSSTAYVEVVPPAVDRATSAETTTGEITERGVLLAPDPTDTAGAAVGIGGTIASGSTVVSENPTDDLGASTAIDGTLTEKGVDEAPAGETISADTSSEGSYTEKAEDIAGGDTAGANTSITGSYAIP